MFTTTYWLCEPKTISKRTKSTRLIGPQIKPATQYEDLHTASTPADVYEAPDGHWTVWRETTVLPLDPVPEYESFHSYIQTLPPWEADLLQHVKLAVDLKYYICFDLQIYFYAGSDGSVKFETNGSFGWMLANTEGDRVASAMGPARCANMDSYRTECTGSMYLTSAF